ncbi:LOW QUALITY PROTEIN: ferredoxin-fold anticodon-binding domain-containing protein 1 [Alca torda]
MTSARREDLASGRQQRHEGAPACAMAGRWRAVRRVLLLGEGNFSFAASLCGAAGPTFVATCYESEEGAGGGGPRERIRRLREAGAEVVFSVDCTKLKDYFLPEEREFDCIYFNFPHCGRKAGVVKNRELLARFFHSSAEVLTEEGEVHVALCNGQGGTPADQPRREWHNSWQIVAVAAGAGFYLSNIHPFKAETIHGYKCTGYRSQDTCRFCIEGALNHISHRSTPLPYFKPMFCEIELESRKVSFQVPQILVDKINRGFLELNSNHPVRTVKEKLTAELNKPFPLQNIDCCLSLLHQGHLNGVCHSNIFWIILSPEESPSTEEMSNGVANAVLFSHVDFCRTHENGWGNVQEACHISKQLYLRPSLSTLCAGNNTRGAFLRGHFMVLSGPVFRKCLISPSMPVFHEVVFVCADRGTENSCIQMLGIASKPAYILFTKTLSGSKLNINLQEATSFETTELNDFAAFESQLSVQYFICMEIDTSGCCEKGSCVGIIRTELVGSELVVVSASLNLDILTMLICGISDWRMLWDIRHRFRCLPRGKLRLFKSFSLYPPSYVHDVSFWVPDGEQFDEVAFHTIARQVSGETVVSIQLIDSFQQSEKTESLCYRLTFQSCDKALSRQEVAEMQLLFRKEIKQRLRVALR